MRLPTQDEVGEKPSLEKVFSDDESALLRYAFGLLGRRELAEEVVQDAFLKLHENWNEVEIPRAWLFRCVRNLSFNILRKNKREILDGTVAEHESSPELERPDEELHKFETVGMVQLFISEMDERDQKMVRMKYFHDLKYQDIADRLGMKVGNVGYRLHHLLKDLRDRLRQSGVHHF